MADLAFDTHKYVKRLTAVGMPEKQAEVIADEQRALIKDQLATKQDIAEVKRDIKALEAAMQLKFKELEQRLTIRLGGMMITGFGVIAALIKFLPSPAP